MWKKVWDHCSNRGIAVTCLIVNTFLLVGCFNYLAKDGDTAKMIFAIFIALGNGYYINDCWNERIVFHIKDDPKD